MPTISHRAQILPQSPIRKLTPYAEKAAKEGKTIYHLNIGQPDIKTPEIAVQAVKDFTPKVLEYTKSEGIDSLREKVVEYYKKHFPSLNYELPMSHALRRGWVVRRQSPVLKDSLLHWLH